MRKWTKFNGRRVDFGKTIKGAVQIGCLKVKFVQTKFRIFREKIKNVRLEALITLNSSENM